MYSSLLLWQIPTSGSLVQAESRLPEILPKPFNLVHAFVQPGDDTDATVAETLPIDKVLLVAEEVALNAQGGGNRA